MTEKRKPTYDLTAIKEAMSSSENLSATHSALRSAAMLDFDPDRIVETIRSMEKEQFVKSMTSYNDHQVWQDVYHVPSEVGVLYVKFTQGTVTEFLLLSFKERDNG